DRDVTCNNRQLMLSRLDERQAKAFTVRCGDQAGAGAVNLFQIFIADAFEPEQALADFRMIAQTIDRFRNVAAHVIGQIFPTFLADDDKIDLKAILPQLSERIQNLQISLTRLNGADHQESGAFSKQTQRPFSVVGQTTTGSSVFDVGAEM